LTGAVHPPSQRAPLLAVLFDATGTLIELREPVGESYARIARQWGVELSARRLDDAFTRVLRHAPPIRYTEAERDAGAICARERTWWRDVVRSTFIATDLATDDTLRFANFEGFFDATFDHYAGAQAWRLRPGALAALPALAARGLRLGVVSNFDQRLINILQKLEIAHFFECVMIPLRCGARKPAPAIFRSALAELGVESREALYVGDDPEDELAATRELGLRVLDVRTLETLEALPARLEAHAKLGPE
jgi:putative hydrolase of the HAD superfamily